MLRILKTRSFLDIFWSFADNILQQVMNFVVGIILARLLMPEEFGLVGIVTAFITFSSVFVDGGFSAALINKKDTSVADYSTVFYTNLLISVFIYLILFLAAESIAVFFGNEEISRLLQLAGLNILLIAFGIIHRTIFMRQLNFKLITIVSLVAVFISSVCAITMAYSGFGVYSLVYRVIIGQLITTVLFWILNKWRPSLTFSSRSFKELFNYGINLFISNLLNKIHANVFYLVIGKFFSASQLGLYTRAATFRDLASTNISNTIQRVSFSTLSKIADESERLRKFYQFINLTYLIASAAMAILFFNANEIVLILLSDRWMSSVWILQILSCGGMFLALYNLNLDYLAVLRKTRSYLRIELFGKFLIFPLLSVGVMFGFKIFLWGIVVHSFVMFMIAVFALSKFDRKVLKTQMDLLLRYSLMFLLLFYLETHVFLDYYLPLVFMIKSSIVLLIFTGFHYKKIAAFIRRRN